MDLLAVMTDNLKTTLPALLIENIVTSAFSSKLTNQSYISIVNKLYRPRIDQQRVLWSIL